MRYKGKEVKIKYIPFPPETGSINGFFSGSNLIDYWLICIDSTAHPQAQRHALGHELAHLYLDHLEQRDRDIWDIEKEASQMAWHFYRLYKSGALEKIEG